MITRPFALVGGLILAGIVVGALGVWLLVPSPSLPSLSLPSSSLPSSRFIGWRLADGFLGTPRFDPTTARTTTAVQISVDWLTCAPQDASWLAPPEVSYTPQSVTITMHTTDTFAATTDCGGGDEPKGTIGIMLDVGIPVEVRLSEPLGGRALFSGGPSPAARPYP